ELGEVEPYDGRRELRPQGDIPPPLVLERVELLDDPWPRLRGKELEGLERRRPDLAEPEALGGLPQDSIDSPPSGHQIGAVVVRPPGRLDRHAARKRASRHKRFRQ